MKAIVQNKYGSADVLELRDIDKPIFGDDEVLLRVRAAGVGPDVWHLMAGQPYLVRIAGMGFSKPKNRVRGWDVAGRVEEVGQKVTEFKPGDEVFGTCKGAFAEYACAKEENLVRKPAALTFEQAAALPVSGCTALQSLRERTKVKVGQKVLVIGAAGGVGSLAVQIAKAFGAEVTGVCSTTKLDLVRSIGAHDVIDYTREDFTDGKRRYDVIVDTAGRRSLSDLRRALVPQGILVIVGGDGGGRWFGGFQRQMLGAPFMSLRKGPKLTGMSAKIRKADLQFLAELVESGKVTPVIDSTYPLSEAAAAVRHLSGGHPKGKIIITV
jgi:NADPH:quinone reductase-like Zn-dependent oxidoreductase